MPALTNSLGGKNTLRGHSTWRSLASEFCEIIQVIALNFRYRKQDTIQLRSNGNSFRRKTIEVKHVAITPGGRGATLV
ncbi:hypothetical protein M422DRAFT_242937 [Sphaerobolus stellatus SS14]|nr:hypothetical protein M422DRAFT_242937 [Sphaerobolus stellatus SS14]